MANRTSFAPGEWYHCYSRGVDKRTVFETTNDYERFLQLLYLLNNTETTHRSDFKKTSTAEVLQIPRGEQIVAVGAYCLMPNHFHVLLKEINGGGISKFMRKLGIAYAMYFNIKHERVGNLFVKPFRSKHVTDDRYFKRVVQYIHLNAADLFEPAWRQKTQSVATLEKKLTQYRYSSTPDYYGINRPEQIILSNETKELFEKLPPIEEVVTDSIEYHLSMSR